MNATENHIEFATINPVAILGPSLNQHMSLSFQFVENIASGKMKRIPNIPMNIIDVRDVAQLHVLAMKTPEEMVNVISPLQMDKSLCLKSHN